MPMHASNMPQRLSAQVLATLPPGTAEVVSGIWAGSHGFTVRCVPTRRTVAAEAVGGAVYGKWRCGRHRDARAEWRWLHALPALGLRTPTPLLWLGSRRRSLLVTASVEGRGLDSWAAQAIEEGWFAALAQYASAVVAPLVRRLHGHGLVYRDLYWNHVFARDPRLGAEPVFLDVERIFRPRWRWRRWVVKDLAGLLASAPDRAWGRPALRFLRAYLGGSARAHRELIGAVVDKATRIRAHVPRFG